MFSLVYLQIKYCIFWFFTVQNNQTLVLSWRLPILESELSNKLRSIRLVVVSKDNNFSEKPQIIVRKDSKIIRRFHLPPRSQYVLLNVKDTLKYYLIPMTKEITFTLYNSSLKLIVFLCSALLCPTLYSRLNFLLNRKRQHLENVKWVISVICEMDLKVSRRIYKLIKIYFRETTMCSKES